MNRLRRPLCIPVVAAILAGCDPDVPSSSAANRTMPVVKVEPLEAGPVGAGPSQPAGALGMVADPVGGVVLDLAGQPVSRARVTLFERTREWPRSGRVRLHSPVWTASDGRFQFGITRRRHLELRVEASGFATQELPSAPQIEDVVIELAPGFRVAGQVLLPDGSRCADCEVFLEPWKDLRLRALSRRTDARGEFEFRGVPAGDIRLVARNPDFQPARTDRVMVGQPRFHTIRFAGRNGLRASGTVRSTDGSPLPGCRVLVYPNSTTGLLAVPYRAKSGVEGRFQVAGLAPGFYTMEVRHDDYATMQRLLPLRTSSSTGLEIQLGERVGFRGRLTGSHGGLAGTRLCLTSRYGEFGSTEVREGGSFVFSGRGFAPGLATLELEQGSACFANSNTRWTRVRLGDDDEECVLATKAPATVVGGRVLDGQGQPIAGVQVVTQLKLWREFGVLKLRPQVLAVTDRHGRYTIRGIGAGQVSLGFKKARFAYLQKVSRVLVDRSARSVPVELQEAVNLLRPGSIEGRVSCGGRAVQGALVVVGRGPNARKTHTGEDGAYRLGGVPPGVRQVRVRLGRLRLEHAEPVELAPGKVVRSVDVVLPSRRIKGRLRDTHGFPMPRMLVEAPSGLVAQTDAEGCFGLDIPPQGTWLSIRLRRGAPVTQRFMVDAGKTDRIEVEVQIAPRAELRGRIVEMPSGRDAVSVLVQFEPASSRVPGAKDRRGELIPDLLKGALWEKISQSATWLARHQRRVTERWVRLDQGRLDLANLPNHPLRMTIRAKGFVPFVKPRVLLSNERPVDLGVVRLRRGARVHGRVVDSWGKPLAGARVVLGRESELANPVAKTVYVTDQHGFFTVRGVAPSNRRIYVASQAFATQVHDLDLPRDLFRSRKDAVRIQMQTGATIEVRVEDKARQPMGFMMVILKRGGEVIARQRTDEAGLAAFTHLGEDHYHIFLQGREKSRLSQTVTDTTGAKVYDGLKIWVKD